ncbi:MAG: 6-carboxytetrahydropterin synthase [Ignavibacteriales bacterium]|nr:6-carboxytetrahydropterin synthase [Ignavibacteriales bacterium]OGU64241.1 MAG: 6-pyruvoyl tetrahydrobiopterin synthase [Stygiobacter sp. GWC2_38_9]OGU82390.1 MAG: 6-pyruvoyl tetrahydrobiopterin synthase [Stygiobacter sp. RIFOXYA12_FULL_38_9]OGV07547.1 MAG: 6-pyruvoyl tetrahydrobiopterin synthase [Stygiobacter sp. RIFOXYB2_FULL_37_11]OGV13808.1 MAG: 6-pyruvoyl tetrahydrobiopterin synthase [Stygiobacter sp. RIFOXYC2_FULL_38_25]OGV24295.1 MAG: 6-pyruvoyl tetrahydrobiopterin synthase [Stygioba
MVYVTRREIFSASHRLFNPNLSEEENNSLFGKCNNPNGHGHNYTLEVTICGEVNPKTGYLIDLKLLKQIIIDNVINKVDHKNLNLDVDFLAGKIPTAENIAIAVWDELENKIPNGKLYSIRLLETENNYIEYKGKNV